MPESLLRDYSTTEAERREILRRKFRACRASLAPEALALFDPVLTEWYSATCDDDKARAERRRQLLDIKAACLQHMSPKGREYYEREIGPAARNGNSLPDPACQPESKAEGVRGQRVDEIWRKTRQVFDKAIARCDLTSANRALHNFTRILQIERSAGNGMEEQVTYPPGVRPLPGAPGGRPHTEKEKKFLEKFKRLSAADRMAWRDGFTACERYVELGGDLADLVKDCSQAEGGQRDR